MQRDDDAKPSGADRRVLAGPARPLAPHGQRKFVRVRDRRADGFIAFDFAIGDPGLAVELILPAAAFSEFCATNQVIELNEAQGRALDADALKWKYGSPGVED